MADSFKVTSPAPMAGGGLYNRSSRVQAVGLRAVLPLFEQAAGSAALSEAPEAIVIADYGSSEGRNSLLPMSVAIAALRRRAGTERAISVVHADLPRNDFASLFQTLADDPDSYLRHDRAVYACAVGRSFYEQILPAGSVTLGWSSWALHYLSRAPAAIPDQVHYAKSSDDAVRAAYVRQAEEDWRTFLAHRARELRPGGRFVILTKALRDDGDSGHQAALLEAIHTALRRLVQRKLVTAAEAARMTIPIASRSRADLVAPFGNGGRFAGLSIGHVEIFNADDPIWEQYERDRDAAKFGARWAAFSRASVFRTLLLGLDGGRDDPRANTFLDRLEDGMAEELAKAPQRMAIPLASMMLAKADRRS